MKYLDIFSSNRIFRKSFKIYLKKQYLENPTLNKNMRHTVYNKLSNLTEAISKQQIQTNIAKLKAISSMNLKSMLNISAYKLPNTTKWTYFQKQFSVSNTKDKTKPDSSSIIAPDGDSEDSIWSGWVDHDLPRNNRTFSSFTVNNRDSNKDPSMLSWIVNFPNRQIKSKSTVKFSTEGRTLFLLKSLASASTVTSQKIRLEDLCHHLHEYPEMKNLLIKKGALPIILKLREKSEDEDIKKYAQQNATMLGYSDPPKGSGLRILSIDGGGTRGIVPIEVLRCLEQNTGKRIYELFDYVCGVSTGAIVVMHLFALRKTIDECEELYRRLSHDIFERNYWLGASKLLWNHAYYDTSFLTEQLKKLFGELSMIETSQLNPNIKLSCISCIVNDPHLNAYVFRNYAFPLKTVSTHPGSFQNKIWEAVRASGAAPGYFESFPLGAYTHQDGGLYANNPTNLAIHEAKRLWPGEKIQCVLSLGTGRLKTENKEISPGLTATIMKVINSATDTEASHITLDDQLPPHTYFRMNPYLSEAVSLDDAKDAKLDLLKNDTLKYLDWNEYKVKAAVKALMYSRPMLSKISDHFAYKKALLKRS